MATWAWVLIAIVVVVVVALRERERARLHIRPLPENTRALFAQEWQDVQERFVDQPADAVVAADRLAGSVMEARGYPMGDFDAQADLVSDRSCTCGHRR